MTIMNENTEKIASEHGGRHLLEDGSPKYTNRLHDETSPYLLQHAHNPVDWYPWGDEAFEKAKDLNRPLFVSIGYSTCHWCHVMEEESFEDEEIADYINTHFVPVKVDREELPDVDAVYMSAVQLMNGNGGWPLNVWMTPDFKPFFGGTYFPPRDGARGVARGFLSMLLQIHNAWTTRPESIISVGTRLTDFMEKALIPEAGNAVPGESVLSKAAASYAKIYDPKNGGIASAPKFPATLNVRFLLRHWKKTGDEKSLEMVVTTLKKMAMGGIYDQAGGGFHRYATDDTWLVPHFEKMLYDNALLAIAYLEGWQATGNEMFKTIVTEILDYITREMTSDEGGFFSATDADTLTPSGEKEEGYHFTWSQKELEAVLDPDDLELAKKVYMLEGPAHFEGRYILHMTESIDDIAEKTGIPKSVIQERITTIRQVLYAARQKRKPPFTDTKILTAWNGMMISAYAKAGLVFGKKQYIQIAKRAADFILSELFKDGTLHRSYKDGQVKKQAYLDDYAFFTAALTDLYEATGDITWLDHARTCNKAMVRLFADRKAGGFFMTSEAHDTLPAKEKPGIDNATPSPNAIAALTMLRLYTLTAEEIFLDHAEKTLITFSELAANNPVACSEMLVALDYYYDKPKEVIIVVPEKNAADKDSFLEAFNNEYLPNRVFVLVDQPSLTGAVQRRIPLLAGRVAINGTTTVYMCEKGTCKLPLTSVDDFAEMLKAN